jgi:hypothetical protein
MRELDSLDKNAKAIAYLAKSRPEYAESAKELTSFVESYQDGARKVANDADIGRAVEILRSVSVFIRSSTGFGKAYLDGIRNELKNAGVLSSELVAVEEPELDFRPGAMLEIEEGVLAPAEIPEEWLEEEGAATEAPSSEVSPLMDIQEGMIPPPRAEVPEEEGVIEISEMDIEPIDEELPEVSDEEIELVEVPPGARTAPPPVAPPVGPAPISRDAAIIISRILEEVDAANGSLAAAGVAGPVHESLSGIKNRLTAAMASGSISDDLSKLTGVLEQAITLADEVSAGDPSAFSAIAPPAMAELLEGVSQIIMTKKANARPLAFIRDGNSWTVLV